MKLWGRKMNVKAVEETFERAIQRERAMLDRWDRLYMALVVGDISVAEARLAQAKILSDYGFPHHTWWTGRGPCTEQWSGTGGVPLQMCTSAGTASIPYGV